MLRFAILVFAAFLPAALPAIERATYNSAGALTALLHDGLELPVRGEFAVDFGHDLHASLQPHDQRSPISREDLQLHWRGSATFPNSAQARFDVAWNESAGALALTGSVTAGDPAHQRQSPLDVVSVDFVLDVPRAHFAGGELVGFPGGPTRIGAERFEAVRETTDQLVFTDAAQNWRLRLALDRARTVTVSDHWDNDGRWCRVRIQLAAGPWPHDTTHTLGLELQLTGRASAPAARLVVDRFDVRQNFAGFGGNFCFGTQTRSADFLLENFRHGWARFELKGSLWDRERAHPGPQLRRDFELIQRAHRLGIPWAISLWRLPERYYADPHRKAPGSFNRKIAADRWPEFLELIGSYLLHLKNEYGAEADLFSFNEPDLGVDIGFTATEHRDAIKRIGAHLASLGLKTKLLLGDTANPRDTHRYILPTAADSEAMNYVGALSFHSWGNGSPEQYRAWGEAARWLGRPLLVGEAGVDPSSWRNRMFDSYAYGLREMKQYHELLRHARPQSLLFWEYTDDYGLLRVRDDGTVEPTGRFHLMKHFGALAPLQSEIVGSDSDQPDVLVTAFAKDEKLTIHVLNLGPARTATLEGLPPGSYRTAITTESDGFVESPAAPLPSSLTLPARSFTTFQSN